MGVVCQKISETDSKAKISGTEQRNSDIYERWPELEESFNKFQKTQGERNIMDKFLENVNRGLSISGKNYIAVIQRLDAEDAKYGTRWLQGIVDNIIAEAQRIIPSLN